MELRQVRHFIAVAEEENFTRAAQRCHIVQSALSTSIKSLEEELDAVLFIRTTRQVKLTMAGRLFLHSAKLAVHHLDKGIEEVKAVSTLQRGTLSIGTVQSLPPFINLPATLSTFLKGHPDFEVKLSQGSSASLNDKIVNQQIDLALMPLEEVAPQLANRIVACDSMVVTFAPDHPLSTRENGTLAEISDYPFIDFEQGQGTRKLIDRGFNAQNLSRRIAFEVSDLDTLVRLVKEGLGIALIPQAVVDLHGEALRSVEVSDVDLCWELVIAWLNHGRNNDDIPDRPTAEFLSLLMEDL